MSKQSYDDFKRTAARVVAASYDEGAFAAMRKTPMLECPYEPMTFPWVEWIDGWIDAKDGMGGQVFVYY